jgi:tRNA-modifying protein YgfZ
MSNPNVNSKTFLFDRSADQGRLELTDRDRLDLLHRMSTNDMNNLAVGQGRSTVLTTALARIIDRLICYNRGETLLALANYPDVVRGWLQKHIFFQDKVKLHDVSAELGQLEVYGPQAATVVESFASDASKLSLHAFLNVETEYGTVLIARAYPLAGDGFMFIVPVAALEVVKTMILKQAQVALGSVIDYEGLRIAAGLPGKDHELTEDYIPLEANLWDSVSFSKGCYIGQEIIARMESRNRLAKTLVPVHIQGQVVEGNTVTDGTRNIGKVTSIVAQSDGTMLGLAFIKPELAEAGTRVIIKQPVSKITEDSTTVDETGEAFVSAEVITPLLNR